MNNNSLRGLAYLSFLLTLFLAPTISGAQFSAADLYARQYQNKAGVADTAAERLLAQRQLIRANQDLQAMEAPVDPAMYRLGPGDGLYLNVYAAHSLDQDLSVTPEGKILVPRTGQIDVRGLTVAEAEKKINELLAKDYRNPNASLSLRRMKNIKVSVLGEVVYPGVQSATALQRLSEVIDKSGGFKGNSSLRNIEVRRTDGSLRAKGDLVRYLVLGDLNANPLIEAGDVVVVPPVKHLVVLNGSVEEPGKIELVDGDQLSLIIKLAKGLRESAMTDSIEVSRFSNTDPSIAARTYVNLASGQDLELKDGDVIFIRSITSYHLPHVVSIAGEVAHPGRYSIDPGETKLSDIIRRAGGALPTASLEEASVLRRVGIGSWESEPELRRLEAIGGFNSERMSDDEYNYFVARMKQMGRTTMVVDFKSLLEKGETSQDLVLRDEDSITLPRARGFVNVSGSVNNQGNVNYVVGYSVEDYIRKAGGYASAADRSSVRVINSRTSSYIDPRSQSDYKVGPGDIIVVPSERPTFWKNFGTVAATTAQIITIIAGVLLIFPRK